MRLLYQVLAKWLQLVRSASGNDSAGGGSIVTIYATVSKTITSASAGDTIYVKRGDTFTMSSHKVLINPSLLTHMVLREATF